MSRPRAVLAVMCCLLTAPVDRVEGSPSTPLASLLMNPLGLLTDRVVNPVGAQASEYDARLQQCWKREENCVHKLERCYELLRQAARVPSYSELEGGLPRPVAPGGQKAEVQLLDLPAPPYRENWLANYARTLHGILVSGLSPSDLEQYDRQENEYCQANAGDALLYCRLAYRALAIERWVQLVGQR